MTQENTEISIKDCIDLPKFDMTTSLYLCELNAATLDYKINWNREWHNGKVCYMYYGIYTNSKGVKVRLKLYDDFHDKMSLHIEYSNHGKLIKKLVLSETYYEDEFIDLVYSIEKYKEYVDLYSGKKDNKNKLTNPYYDRVYNQKEETKSYTVTKVKNQRGIKAEKLLKNVEFEWNMEILGEITTY